jgi:hypothetical protein
VLATLSGVGCAQITGKSDPDPAPVAVPVEEPARPGFAAYLAKELGGDEPPAPSSDRVAPNAQPDPSTDAGPITPAPGSSPPTSSPAQMSGAAPTPTPGQPAASSSPPRPGPPSAPQPDAATASAPRKPPPPVPAELSKIQIKLFPSWERDVEGPGTISLPVKALSRNISMTFVFHYGFEEPAAPVERDDYKRWLGETKRLVVKDDRQRAATWYLEGIGADGKPAFRYVVSYGPQKLVCYGSLYKHGDALRLGDIRDEVIVQIKNICETVAL